MKIWTMCEAYRVSSSVKVKQMEAELSQQLSALRAEIEENGFPLGAEGFNSYRDVSFFRVEREHALRRGLQVAEALPVRSAADVIQRELQSCLSLEYSPDSLPLLLHQFYTDRSFHLAQIKYQLMLRWTRFCRHTGVIEELYPHYKDQVRYLTEEYEDAVQRARRLSASREKMLTGRGNIANLLTQDDVVIYLRRLVCHLQAVKNIHNFLRALHYVPASERRDAELEVDEGTLHDNGASGRAVPLHTAHLEELLPELQALITDFHLPYDAENVRTPADEMELFSVVWTHFRRVFRRQQQMKTFPQYDGSDATESQWGRRNANTALRKEADWIPFIRVKPRRDPWQQKILTELKERSSVDELMKAHCRFLQESDLLHVAADLKHQTSPPVGILSSSSVSRSRKNKRQAVSEIWTRLYSAQETMRRSSRSRGSDGERPTSTDGSSSLGDRLQVLGMEDSLEDRLEHSLEDRLQILGLEDSMEDGPSDPVRTRGAHLSLVFLRHLKLRDLQRISLGMLNYLRSMERTLTFDLAGLQQQDEELCSTAEETGWMNAARGGRGQAGGLGSFQHAHNSPVDYKVRCSEFMQFAEVENLQDFYSREQHVIHTQDQRGFFIVYDAALQDLDQLQDQILLIGSHFIHRHGTRTEAAPTSTADRDDRAGTEVDRVRVLLDLWTCEVEFLESKVQLLNCYYEAYQHAAGAEERCALAQVLTDIMHRRPQLDLNQDYFVRAYRKETGCMQSHQQLIRDVLDHQIKTQRQYLERIWRDDRRGSSRDFGLPLNYVPKHLVSLGGSSPALMNIFLLEVHPSLCLSSAVYEGLLQAHADLCQLHRASSVPHKLVLQQRVLQRALQSWDRLSPPGASYSCQTQRDLFSGVFIEDPVLVQKAALSLLRSAEERDVKQRHAVETFCSLLEVVTLRHRLLESASETEHLGQLYRDMASELGFGDFHLHLRPLQFELAEPKEQQRSAFITAAPEVDSVVDRFIPAHLPLSIQELDPTQIGRFSFSSEEAVIQLLNSHSMENLQVSLACQVTQRNALIAAVKLACVCHWAQRAESEHKDGTFESGSGKRETSSSSPSSSSSNQRVTEAFVSIQLQKAGLRDEMLDLFVKKQQALGSFMRTPEEAAKIKREHIIDFLKKFCSHTSVHCVTAQIVSYYYSLTSLLDDVPSVRQSCFVIGRAAEPKVALDAGADLSPDNRTSDRRPLQLLSDDGKTVLNLWYIPHFTEVLHIFRTRDVPARAEALHHTLQIVSALRDIVHHLVSFSKLGNRGESSRWRRGRDAAGSHLSADWGGAEGVGAELQDLQQQVERLSASSSPQAVGRLLQLRRQVVLLQFDTAVRNLIRESFLSSGDVTSFQSVTDNMEAALPLLSDIIQPDVFSLTLPVPPPLEPRGRQAQTMFPWRSFIASHGLQPLRVWDVPPVEFCIQLCLSSLSDRSRLQANAAVHSLSLLMEDVLNSDREAEPVRLHGGKDDLQQDGKPNKEDQSCTEDEDEDEEERKKMDSSAPLQDPIRVQTTLKGFLLLTKQLHVFKERWAQRRLGEQVFGSPAAYQQLVRLYRAEVFQPSMRSLAHHMGKELQDEASVCSSRSLLPPAGASEVDVRVWQLKLLMELSEADMIRAVQTRISRELSLVVSERTRRDDRLPTDLWKKTALRFSLPPERPPTVETFVQQLMEGAEQAEGQLKVSEDHLQRCLALLSSSVMERERRSFLFYSQFYERILQQETQLLYQREQDVKSLKDARRSDARTQASDLCRGMMMEISALQAAVAQLEEERRTLEEHLSLRFRERYNPLVRHLFSTCIQLKATLDEYRWKMARDVSVMVTRIRKEGADRVMKVKKKYGCNTDTEGASQINTQLKQEDVHELSLENSRLTALLRKLKALNRWRKMADEKKLHRQLLQSQQREASGRCEALRGKMASEEEVLFLQEELDVVRRALSRCQEESSNTKQLLSRKTQELQATRHRSALEARRRQELDSRRVQNLEEMRADVEDKESRLKELGEQLDRGSRTNRLRRQRSAKEIRQMRDELQRQRSLKQRAVQQLDSLQNQVTHTEAALPRHTRTAGQNQTGDVPSGRKLRTTSPSAGPQTSRQELGSLTTSSTMSRTLWDVGAETGHRRAGTGRDGPEATPPRRRVQTAESFLPDL